jgi:hypothetical protein
MLRGSGRRQEHRIGPVRLWFGLVLLTLSAMAVLATTGVLGWEQTVGRWWPVAIIGWGLADMVADREVTLGGSIITTVGLLLLADEQDWAIEGSMWTAVFLVAGIRVLLGPRRRAAPSR